MPAPVSPPNASLDDQRLLARALALINLSPARITDHGLGFEAGAIARLALPPGFVAALARAGLVTVDEHDRVTLSDLGRARVARLRQPGGEPDFRQQHGAVRSLPPTDARPPRAAGDRARINIAESPLGWLATRRGPDGRPFLDPASIEAGERLRADFTRGAMMPSVTSNWGALLGSGGSGGGPGRGIDLNDAAIAARVRVERALEAVGPELSGVLVDVCCFLKGLETVEDERRWPPRSAKIVLVLALARLATHYGLANHASGPDRARRTGHWGTPDYRPSIGG